MSVYLSVCVCVIRMDGQTACRILTKIWEWIAIYPRGNIGGRYLPNNPLRGRPHGVGLAKFNRRRDSARDHVCLLVDVFANRATSRRLPLAGVWLSAIQ